MAENGRPRNGGTFLDAGPGDPGWDTARVVLIPVPYDSTTSYRTGARGGPRAIIEASRQLEDYDLELDRDISEVGIRTAPEVEVDASGPRAMVERVRLAVEAAAAGGQIVGLLGGEHSITVGAVQALTSRWPDLTVLYLDAHADMRDEYMGTGWGHASVARRVSEICGVVEVGVRSLSASEREFITETEVPVIYWPPPRGMDWVAAEVLSALSPHVYISVDLDVLDPSVMAAVGTPEPGGMSWLELTELLRAVGQARDVVGFDLTELSPREGPEAAAYTAAKLGYKLIGYATA